MALTANKIGTAASLTQYRFCLDQNGYCLLPLPHLRVQAGGYFVIVVFTCYDVEQSRVHCGEGVGRRVMNMLLII